MLSEDDTLVHAATRMQCFESFQLDVSNQCLWHEHTRVSLMPKPFAVLTYLVQHAGQLVSQDALMNAVWPDTHVQSDVLRKHIKEIRRVLGDSATTPRFIETLPKRGYRFIAPVTDQPLSAGPAGTPTALIGRTEALATLHEYMTRALAGDRQIVFVVGEPGIGKTSVVEAFQRAVSPDETLRVTWGQSVEGFGGKEPYYPLLEAIGRLGRGPDRPLVVDALTRHAPTWLMQFPSFVPPAERPAVRRAVVGATRDRMVRELCEALETMSQRLTLVVVLEDLHWVDHSTLDVLSAIARRREPARLLLVGTCRPAGVILAGSPFKSLRRDLLVHRLAHEIALERLSVSDVAAYIATAFAPHDLPQGFAELVHQRSDGNPLFMSATLDHLVQRGILVQGRAGWCLTLPIDQIEPDVPDTLRHMLELQLDQLSDEERHVLTAASVAGERFSAWAITTMLADDHADTEGICGRVADREQFVRGVGTCELADGQPTAAFEFKHALYRDALYRRMAPTIRLTYHRRLAEGLEGLTAGGSPAIAGELAAHYEAARVYDRAISCLIVAADNALRRYAHPEAIAWLEHARELAQKTSGGSRQRDVALLQKIGDVHYARGDMLAAADAYEAAVRLAADGQLPDAAARALMRLARSAIFFDIDRAIASCERAAELSHRDGAVALETKATEMALGWDLLHRGWSAGRADAAVTAFQALATEPSELTPADQLLYSNVQMFRSQYVEAYEAADAALCQLTDADTLWEHLAALSAKAGALSFLGRCGDAYHTVMVGIDLAQKNANGPWLDILSGILGFVHLQACDFAGARHVTSSRLHRTAPEPGPRSAMQLVVARGLADLALGRIDEAAESFTTICAQPMHEQPLLHWYWRVFARLGLAEAAFAAGDLARAHEGKQLIVDAVSQFDESMIQSLAWEFSARVSLAEGAREDAEAAIDRALHCLARFEVPHAAWRVHATAAAVHRRTKTAQAERHVDQARAALTTLVRSLERCEPLRRSLVDAPAVNSILNGHLLEK